MAALSGETPLSWDNFLFVKFLGRGSFGWVFEAKQENWLGIPDVVAVKILFDVRKGANQEVVREHHNVHKIEHENIVRSYKLFTLNISDKSMESLKALVLDVNLKDEFLVFISRASRSGNIDITCIVMEVCNMTLADALRPPVKTAQAELTLADKYEICKGLVNGVRHLQQNRIMHRDLKPSNIYLSNNGVKIGDFGFSRLTTENSKVTPGVGTTIYLAPEANSVSYRSEVDIFSLGLNICEIFLPPDVAIRNNVFFAIRSRNYEDIEQYLYIPHLKDVVIAFTSADPAVRLSAFQTLDVDVVFSRGWDSHWDMWRDCSKVKDLKTLPKPFLGMLWKYAKINEERSSQLQIDSVLSNVAYSRNISHHMKSLCKRLKTMIVKDGGAVNVNNRWIETIGELLPRVTYSSFSIVNELMQPPQRAEQHVFFNNAVWYVLQCLKMSDVQPLTAKFVADLVSKGGRGSDLYDDGSSDDNSVVGARFGRLELLVCLLQSTDVEMGYELTRTIGQFNTALPLVMPKLYASQDNSYLVTISWLQSIITKSENTNANIEDNYLFRSEFRLLVCIRIGVAKYGKSYVLNQLLKTSYTFASSHDPGSSLGVPALLNGTVELIRLTAFNCGDEMYAALKTEMHGLDNPGALLLANLHGDAREWKRIIEFIKPITGGYLVFHYEGCKQDRLQLYEHSVEDNLWSTVEIRKQTRKDCLVKLQPLTADVKSHVARRISKAFLSCLTRNSTNCQFFPTDSTIQVVKAYRTDESVKLESLFSKYRWSDLKSSFFLQKKIITAADASNDWNEFKNNEMTITILNHVMRILPLPLLDRKAAINHVEREMAYITSHETKTILSELLRLKRERATVYNAIDKQKARQSTVLKNLEEEIYNVSVLLEANNFALEHLFRELGGIYELSLHLEDGCETTQGITTVMRNLAELFLEGQAIELVNGDLGNINGKWLEAMLTEVEALRSNMNIFVISIIGLQSSGKSTLLNSLFGCRFPVSPGRCTRGLFMRILILDEALQRKLRYHAIVLIDTEGMCAPEKLIDPAAEQRDREMATFAMLVSNLTLINIFGETMKEISDILQIVVVTLARLEKVDVSPDVLLLQHCQVVDEKKLQSAADEFCNAINAAIEVTCKQFTKLGIVNSSSLKSLCDRVKNDQLLHLFHPYRCAPYPDAPPSSAYNDDIKKLYRTILRIMEISTKNTLFASWSRSLLQFWSALKMKILRFASRIFKK